MADVEEGIGAAEKAPASSLAQHRGSSQKEATKQQLLMVNIGLKTC